MLYVLFEKYYTEEEAAKLTNRNMLVGTESAFNVKRDGVDLNKDEFFKRCCKEVDLCDIPFRNVLLDTLNGETHSFDKVSGGVRALWLMRHFHEEFILPSCFMGPNCYALMVESSADRDIYIYDDSEMFLELVADELKGQFVDYHSKEVVTLDNAGAKQFWKTSGCYDYD